MTCRIVNHNGRLEEQEFEKAPCTHVLVKLLIIIELEGETRRETAIRNEKDTTRGSAELKVSYREAICI